MKSIAKIAVFGLIGALLVFGPGAVAVAGSHTWVVWSVFSNAAGNIQYITVKEAFGGTAEGGLSAHTIQVNPSGGSHGMHNVTGNTANTYYLLGTQDYADLPGTPAPDEIIAPNFINTLTDNDVLYVGGQTFSHGSWTAGTLPTNGLDMLERATAMNPALGTAPNVAFNYAGVSGCVDLTGTAAPLPGVPDGTNGSSMKVGKLAPNGTSLSVTWDTATCTDTNDHQIVYGQKSGFPAKPGGLYTVQGGACGIGSASPYTWTPTPSAIDGSGLTWFLVVTTDGAGTEGPWGTFNGVDDRNGTGGRCSSGVCAATTKSLAGSCGL
jgi:hypothetical protein